VDLYSALSWSHL